MDDLQNEANPLREFVLTTVILTPAREVGRVLIAVFAPFPDFCRANRACRANSERLIWIYNYNGFGTFDPENGSRNSKIFNFQRHIYLKVEHAFSLHFQNFDF